MHTRGVALKIHNLYAGSWLSNCYVLISEDKNGKNHAAVIDPSADAEDITALLKCEDATLDMIILTHGHFDHIMSLDALRQLTGAPAYIHESDDEMLEDSKKNAYSFFFGDELIQKKADKTLRDGDALSVGDENLMVIHLPGHSKGSIALLGDGFLITGDTLFAQGFGRYDLHGGDALTLKKSLNSLKELDRTLTIYAGHGESAKLGEALHAISYFTN